jgi:hypothetical protein
VFGFSKLAGIKFDKQGNFGPANSEKPNTRPLFPAWNQALAIATRLDKMGWHGDLDFRVSILFVLAEL